MKHRKNLSVLIENISYMILCAQFIIQVKITLSIPNSLEQAHEVLCFHIGSILNIIEKQIGQHFRTFTTNANNDCKTNKFN